MRSLWPWIWVLRMVWEEETERGPRRTGTDCTLSPGSTPPMAIVGDGVTGTIRAFPRDWDGTVPADVEDGTVPLRDS